MTSPPRLTVYRCPDDGQLVVARADACPTCGRTDLEPHEVPGDGFVVVWTTIHVPPTRYAGEAPYTVVIVELDCGLRTMGRLADHDWRAPGARVRLHHVDPERGPMFEAVDNVTAPAYSTGSL